jgi:hypothetical protein
MDDLSETHKLAGVPPLISPLLMPLNILQQISMDMMRSTIAAYDTASANDGTANNQSQALQEPRTMQEPRTIINRRDNITINRSEKILDEQVPGHLDEIVIKSTSNFSIEVIINGNLFIHESMTDLIDTSADISSIVAIYDGTNYMFSISDITYNDIMIRPFLSGRGTFDIFKKLTRGADGNRY